MYSGNALMVELSWDDGVSWTAPKSDAVESLTERTVVLGSPTDGWGHAWDRSDMNNGHLRVRVTALSDTLPHAFNLDWIPVCVYYGP